MAGTQHYGRPDYQLGDGAHHACGRQFPTCNDGFLPFGESRLVDIHLTHRVFMYITTVLVIWLAVCGAARAVPSPGVVRAAHAMIGILGRADPARRPERVAGGVRGADPRATSTVGTLLWAAAAWRSALQLYRVPAPDRRPRTRALPAARLCAA